MFNRIIIHELNIINHASTILLMLLPSYLFINYCLIQIYKFDYLFILNKMDSLLKKTLPRKYYRSN